MAGFNEIIITMAQADFFTGILPFLLSYILFFVVLQRVPLFEFNDSDLDKTKFTALIALVLAFFTTRFLVANPAYQFFFQDYFGRLAIGMIGLLGFLVFMGFTGIKMKKLKVPLLFIIVILGTLSAFGLSGGLEAFLPGVQLPLIGVSLAESVTYLIDSGVVYILLIGGALYWVTTDSGDKEESKGAKNALKWLISSNEK